MIKISDKIWYVIKPEHEDELAYMCPYEETKDGVPLSGVAKMQSTGRSWAKIHPQNVYKMDDNNIHVRDEQGRAIIDYVKPAKEGEEFISDNSPIDGFYIGSSVSRWSTSNKLFRVKDPRGFTVEVPTDNIATLLHHTTVVNGFVQEQCVWGREGNSHILLPVNSEPYLETLDKMDVIQNKLISIQKLKRGDWVKLFENEQEYYYFGKVKITWEIIPSWYERNYYNRQQVFGEKQIIKDDKWTHVFLYKYSHDKEGKYYHLAHQQPKIVKIIKNEILDIDFDQIVMYVPQRVSNKIQGNAERYYSKSKIISMEFK